MSQQCNGFGECFKQCCCNCFENCEHQCECSEEDEYGNFIDCYCDCGCRHKEDCEWTKENGIHKKCTFEWCLVPTNCPHNCEFKKCQNFIICNNKAPFWFLDCHNGTCGSNCDMQYGPLTFLEDIEECCVCFENKKMVKLLCDHKFCLDCIKQECNNLRTNRCPLCRNVLYMDIKI